MKKLTAILLSLVLIILSFCGCSSKDNLDSLERILENKKIIIGVNGDNLPLSYISGGEFVGFDVDIAKEVAKRLDVAVEFKNVAPADVITALDNREIDCYWCYDSPTRTQMSQALFAEALYKRTQSFLVKIGNGTDEIIDLKGKKIGCESGSAAESALADATVLTSSFASCTAYDNFETLSTALAKNEIDAAVVDSIYSKYAFISKNKSAYTLLDTALSTSDCRMVFRKKDSVLKNRIYAILDNMQEDSTVVNISQQWFGEDITQGIRFDIKTAE